MVKFRSQIRRSVYVTALLSALAGSGCTGIVGKNSGEGTVGGPATGTSSAGTSATANGSTGASGGANAGVGPGNADSPGGGPATDPSNPSNPTPQVSACDGQAVAPSAAPIRRLSRQEYDNTVADLLFDTTSPAINLPPEVLGNGFSNDALQQTASADLVSGYSDVASDIATRALQPATLAKLAPCAATAMTPALQATCAQSFIASWVPQAYRRPLVAGESDALLALEQGVTASDTFSSGLGAIIEAVLQSPDFLYRPEFGAPDPVNAALRRPTGDEMATRLSYLFWGSQPDDALRASAANGELLTADGILKSAKRLLAGDKAHGVVKFFFDSLLPITTLTDQTRDATLYPTFSPTIGKYMRQETEMFLDNQVFTENGTWPSVFTANYTFVNDALATYYGFPGVTGAAFQKVQLDPTRRLGLLTQGAIMTGTTVTNSTNPVLRGSFILNKLMCMNISLPSDPAILAQVKVPSDVSGNTARERFTAHSQQAICQGCHRLIDPVGFALENYDAVGLYRTTENGEAIDASGKLPQATDTIVGAVQLAQQLAASDLAQNCFAQHWLEYGYGRSLRGTPEDLCLQEKINTAFKTSGYNVQQLLLNLTQTPAFQYLPSQE